MSLISGMRRQAVDLGEAGATMAPEELSPTRGDTDRTTEGRRGGNRRSSFRNKPSTEVENYIVKSVAVGARISTATRSESSTRVLVKGSEGPSSSAVALSLAINSTSSIEEEYVSPFYWGEVPSAPSAGGSNDNDVARDAAATNPPFGAATAAMEVTDDDSPPQISSSSKLSKDKSSSSPSEPAGDIVPAEQPALRENASPEQHAQPVTVTITAEDETLSIPASSTSAADDSSPNKSRESAKKGTISSSNEGSVAAAVAPTELLSPPAINRKEVVTEANRTGEAALTADETRGAVLVAVDKTAVVTSSVYMTEEDAVSVTDHTLVTAHQITEAAATEAASTANKTGEVSTVKQDDHEQRVVVAVAAVSSSSSSSQPVVTSLPPRDDATAAVAIATRRLPFEVNWAKRKQLLSCGVCGGRAAGGLSMQQDPLNDEMITCSSCDVAVHKDCAKGFESTTEKTNGKWRCPSCTNSSSTHCVFCDVRTQLLMRRPTYDDCGSWVHSTCLHAGSAEELYSPKEGGPLVCGVCSKSNLLIVKCKADGCNKSFHPSCAWLKGYDFTRTSIDSKKRGEGRGAVESSSSSSSSSTNKNDTRYKVSIDFRLEVFCDSHSQTPINPRTREPKPFRPRPVPTSTKLNNNSNNAAAIATVSRATTAGGAAAAGGALAAVSLGRVGRVHEVDAFSSIVARDEGERKSETRREANDRPAGIPIPAPAATTTSAAAVGAVRKEAQGNREPAFNSVSGSSSSAASSAAKPKPATATATATSAAAASSSRPSVKRLPLPTGSVHVAVQKHPVLTRADESVTVAGGGGGRGEVRELQKAKAAAYSSSSSVNTSTAARSYYSKKAAEESPSSSPGRDDDEDAENANITATPAAFGDDDSDNGDDDVGDDDDFTGVSPRSVSGKTSELGPKKSNTKKGSSGTMITAAAAAAAAKASEKSGKPQSSSLSAVRRKSVVLSDEQMQKQNEYSARRKKKLDSEKMVELSNQYLTMRRESPDTDQTLKSVTFSALKKQWLPETGFYLGKLSGASELSDEILAQSNIVWSRVLTITDYATLELSFTQGLADGAAAFAVIPDNWEDSNVRALQCILEGIFALVSTTVPGCALLVMHRDQPSAKLLIHAMQSAQNEKNGRNQPPVDLTAEFSSIPFFMVAFKQVVADHRVMKPPPRPPSPEPPAPALAQALARSAKKIPSRAKNRRKKKTAKFNRLKQSRKSAAAAAMDSEDEEEEATLSELDQDGEPALELEPEPEPERRGRYRRGGNTATIAAATTATETTAVTTASVPATKTGRPPTASKTDHPPSTTTSPPPSPAAPLPQKRRGRPPKHLKQTQQLPKAPPPAKKLRKTPKPQSSSDDDSGALGGVDGGSDGDSLFGSDFDIDEYHAKREASAEPSSTAASSDAEVEKERTSSSSQISGTVTRRQRMTLAAAAAAALASSSNHNHERGISATATPMNAAGEEGIEDGKGNSSKMFPLRNRTLTSDSAASSASSNNTRTRRLPSRFAAAAAATASDRREEAEQFQDSTYAQNYDDDESGSSHPNWPRGAHHSSSNSNFTSMRSHSFNHGNNYPQGSWPPNSNYYRSRVAAHDGGGSAASLTDPHATPYWEYWQPSVGARPVTGPGFRPENQRLPVGGRPGLAVPGPGPGPEFAAAGLPMRSRAREWGRAIPSQQQAEQHAQHEQHEPLPQHQQQQQQQQQPSGPYGPSPRGFPNRTNPSEPTPYGPPGQHLGHDNYPLGGPHNMIRPSPRNNSNGGNGNNNNRPPPRFDRRYSYPDQQQRIPPDANNNRFGWGTGNGNETGRDRGPGPHPSRGVSGIGQHLPQRGGGGERGWEPMRGEPWGEQNRRGQSGSSRWGPKQQQEGVSESVTEGVSAGAWRPMPKRSSERTVLPRRSRSHSHSRSNSRSVSRSRSRRSPARTVKRRVPGSRAPGPVREGSSESRGRKRTRTSRSASSSGKNSRHSSSSSSRSSSSSSRSSSRDRDRKVRGRSTRSKRSSSSSSSSSSGSDSSRRSASSRSSSSDSSDSRSADDNDDKKSSTTKTKSMKTQASRATPSRSRSSKVDTGKSSKPKSEEAKANKSKPRSRSRSSSSSSSSGSSASSSSSTSSSSSSSRSKSRSRSSSANKQIARTNKSKPSKSGIRSSSRSRSRSRSRSSRETDGAKRPGACSTLPPRIHDTNTRPDSSNKQPSLLTCGLNAVNGGGDEVWGSALRKRAAAGGGEGWKAEQRPSKKPNTAGTGSPPKGTTSAAGAGGGGGGVGLTTRSMVVGKGRVVTVVGEELEGKAWGWRSRERTVTGSTGAGGSQRGIGAAGSTGAGAGADAVDHSPTRLTARLKPPPAAAGNRGHANNGPGHSYSVNSFGGGGMSDGPRGRLRPPTVSFPIPHPLILPPSHTHANIRRDTPAGVVSGRGGGGGAGAGGWPQGWRNEAPPLSVAGGGRGGVARESRELRGRIQQPPPQVPVTNPERGPPGYTGPTIGGPGGPRKTRWSQ